MPVLSLEETLPYRAADLYDLVMTVEDYPKIFPDIREVAVRHINQYRKEVDVTVDAPFSAFQYRCEVTGSPPGRIGIRATEGAFKSMDAEWTFTSLPQGGTRVGYRMEFDFGGFGLKNLIAEGFIRQNMGTMLGRLRAHAAKTLQRDASAADFKPAGP